MSPFRYKAATPIGEVIKGEVEADSEEAVIQRLQADGHIPIRVERINKTHRLGFPRLSLRDSRRVTSRDLGVMTMELATLLNAGLSLDRTLDLMTSLADRESVRDLLSRVRTEVRGGAGLYAAMKKQDDIFSDFYLNMIRAGEESGALEQALARLSDFMDRSRELRETLTSALIYPLILVVLAGISVAVLLAFVVPRFEEMFRDSGAALPWATQAVMGVGSFVQNYGWLLAIGGTAGFVALRHRLKQPEGRLAWDARILTLPLAGSLIRKLEAARFTRTLGVLLANGAPLPNAVRIAQEVIGNQAVAKSIASLGSSIREGRGLAVPLSEAGVFPPLVTQLVLVGEETGDLEHMLLRVADVSDREVETSVRRLVALLEPVLIVTLGLIIAGIIMSMLVAMMAVNELAF